MVKKGLLLAAGRGSRLKEITNDRPKCLAMLGGRTLLDWQLEALRFAGLDSIALVRGYLAETLSPRDVTFFHNSRWAETNMVMSLRTASSWLSTSICIVSYSDIVYPSDTVRKLMSAEGDLVVSYDTNWIALWAERFDDPLSDAETFDVDNDGRLIEIGARPQNLYQVNGQYMGLLKITPSGWRIIDKELESLSGDERDRLDMTSLLKHLLRRHVDINTVAVDGRWCEIDTPEDLACYAARIKQADETGVRWLHDWR